MLAYQNCLEYLLTSSDDSFIFIITINEGLSKKLVMISNRFPQRDRIKIFHKAIQIIKDYFQKEIVTTILEEPTKNMQECLVLLGKFILCEKAEKIHIISKKGKKATVKVFYHTKEELAYSTYFTNEIMPTLQKFS